ncbi:hypothetical protein K7W42_10620 [Deinococcus sp. HMF7604]|uniref:hypothetical protein n=1 Tax=Deinococcus betulae TaxID=2873312 RepID=UPI001CCCEBE4|nr:hypothetical protein [Deinococcus betulae]MBZ9751318.1 hypothetical protein [Deinococcus betulae]
MSPHHLALLLTGALLLALLALGVQLQRGHRLGRARWLHHALFFAVCVGTALSGTLAVLSGAFGWALLPALALLLTMPRTRPGRADHWQRALACAAAFAVGVWGAWG